MFYRIENNDRPGHYWSSHLGKFCSEFGDDYRLYRTKGAAMRVARKLSKTYGVAVLEYSPPLPNMDDAGQRAFEVANGMRGYAGSAAEKEDRHYEYWLGGEKHITQNRDFADRVSTCDIKEC